jgi:hypothetical protein
LNRRTLEQRNNITEEQKNNRTEEQNYSNTNFSTFISFPSTNKLQTYTPAFQPFVGIIVVSPVTGITHRKCPFSPAILISALL